jgi:hypothetical protein
VLVIASDAPVVIQGKDRAGIVVEVDAAENGYMIKD